MEKTLTVNLYLLFRTEAVMPGEYSACVVAAATEKNAREMANEYSGSIESGEGYPWTDSARTEAKNLGVASDETAGIVLWSKEQD